MKFRIILLFCFFQGIVADSVFAGVDPDTLNVLFIGNSYTQRNTLTQAVKLLAEEGNPGMVFNVSIQTYGGRTLKDHWRLRTQNFVKQTALTLEEQQATIAYLEATIANDPTDSYAVTALSRHRELLKSIGTSTIKKWDIVVLQSWRDDLNGATSLYMTYAPMFADLIKAQGGRVILYETTPTTQNEYPLTSPPTNRAIILEKAVHISNLSRQVGATVTPMSMVALRCQTYRPDFTLRYPDDNHPSQTMTYLTACTIYSTLFNHSPEGLSLDRIDDATRNPSLKIFSDIDRLDLQRIAWDGLNEFRENFPSGLSENENYGMKMKVFPNPANKFIKLNFRDFITHGPVKLNISAVDGKTIYSETRIISANEDIIIDIATLPSSLYLIRAETNEGVFISKIIVNEH